MARVQSSLQLVARWLAEEVGEGKVFTKHELRAALPGFEQVDRRMRELRRYGWRIDTNREDGTLRPGELRLIVAGPQPGEPSFRAAVKHRVSSKERLSAISMAGFRCQLCGIQLGEPDESESGSANLVVKRFNEDLFVSCGLCAPASVAYLRGAVDQLSVQLSTLPSHQVSEVRTRILSSGEQSPLEAVLAVALRVPLQIALKAVDEQLGIKAAPGQRA